MSSELVKVLVPVSGEPKLINEFADSHLMDSIRKVTGQVPPGENGYWMLNFSLPDKDFNAAFVEKVGDHVSIVFTGKYHWGDKVPALGIAVAGTF